MARKLKYPLLSDAEIRSELKRRAAVSSQHGGLPLAEPDRPLCYPWVGEAPASEGPHPDDRNASEREAEPPQLGKLYDWKAVGPGATTDDDIERRADRLKRIQIAARLIEWVLTCGEWPGVLNLYRWCNGEISKAALGSDRKIKHAKLKYAITEFALEQSSRDKYCVFFDKISGKSLRIAPDPVQYLENLQKKRGIKRLSKLFSRYIIRKKPNIAKKRHAAMNFFSDEDIFFTPAIVRDAKRAAIAFLESGELDAGFDAWRHHRAVMDTLWRTGVDAVAAANFKWPGGVALAGDPLNFSGKRLRDGWALARAGLVWPAPISEARF